MWGDGPHPGPDPLTDTISYRINTILNRISFSGEERVGTQDLTNAELAIMELLWESQRLTARQIRERLYGDSDKAQHGTVQRLLASLEEKQFVRRDKSLGVQLFSASVSREVYGSLQLESLANKLTGGSIAPLLTHLLDQKKLGKAEIKRLRKLLEEAQKRV
jgi:BlaI family penicillinase repressor